MASSTAGKKSLLQVSSVAGGAGTYYTVLGIESLTWNIAGANVDDSEMGVDWVQRIQALKDCKVSASGGRRQADATGQGAVLSALVNDTELWMKVLYDGTHGFKQQCVVAKFDTDGKVADKVTVAIDLEGTGVVTLI